MVPLLLGANGEPLVYGKTIGGVITPIQVDGDGVVAVIGKAYPGVYLDGVWYKPGVHRMMTGVHRGYYYNTSLAAGTNNIDSDAVGSDEIHFTDSIIFIYFGTVTNVRLTVAIYDGSNYTSLYRQVGVTSGLSYNIHTSVTLVEGERLRYTIENATSGDDAYMYVASNVYNLNSL
jgi:hypothetical protein